MNKKIEQLTKKIQGNQQKRDTLTEQIKKDETRLKELKNAEIVSEVNSLAQDGVNMDKVMNAIRRQDIDTLLDLISTEGEKKNEPV
jgi:septal ring factor EnvC (AmiA/AmiB activator)